MIKSLHSFAVFIFLILVPVSYGCAQEPNITPSPQEISSKVLDGIMAGEDVFDNIFSKKMTKFVESGINEAKSELITFSTMGGEFQGYEFYFEEQLSNRITRVVFFLYTENFPLIFDFYYYKTNDKWNLVAFNFDADFIEFSKKKYNIKP